MAVEFRNVHCPPLDDFSAAAPDACVIGIVGERGSGKSMVLKLAAGMGACNVGEVVSEGTRRYIGPNDRLVLAPADIIALDNAFALHDAIVRARGMVALERLRRTGSTILLSSHEPDLVRTLCDEVWWLGEGRLIQKGDPREVLDAYSRSICDKFRDWGETIKDTMVAAMRRGNGAAEVVSIETLGSRGEPTIVWRSGEQAGIRVTVRYVEAAPDPVVGIMVRTRIGFEVYGTNTEAEGVRIGPCEPGDTIAVTFTFPCELCAQDYTVTAASHDPDGIAHDWLDDAVAVTVADTRYTAGVANLHAEVAVERKTNAGENACSTVLA